METCATRTTDTLLLPFLKTPSEAEAERCLERLLQDHAEPIITGILRRRWQVSLGRPGTRETPEEQAARDAYSDAVTQLITQLRDCRTGRRREPIGDFRGYVAVTTFRACDSRLRCRCPERESLRSRLRYLLTHSPGLACWPETSAGRKTWLGGFAAWRDSGAACASPAVRCRLRDEAERLRFDLPGEASPGAVLTRLFTVAGQPLPVEDLVTLLARQTEPGAARPRAQDTDARRLEEVGDPNTDVAGTVARRLYLKRLWGEVSALPREQRRALLLNLRDASGRGVLDLFPLSGVAAVRDIARALEIPAEEMAALWNTLPLEDAVIAGFLGVKRQQVINLRMTARKRLARRMAAYEKED